MINLLPPNLTANKGLAKIQKTMKTVTLVSVVVFIVFGLGVLGFFILGSLQLGNINSRQEALKAGIKQRETTEQRLVLLKDRIAKIKVAKGQDSSQEELEAIDQILGLTGEAASVSELSFDATKADLSLVFRDSSQLGVFLKALASSSPFETVILKTFGFSPTAGYLLGLSMSGAKL